MQRLMVGWAQAQFWAATTSLQYRKAVGSGNLQCVPVCLWDSMLPRVSGAEKPYVKPWEEGVKKKMKRKMFTSSIWGDFLLHRKAT